MELHITDEADKSSREILPVFLLYEYSYSKLEGVKFIHSKIAAESMHKYIQRL